MDEVGIGLLRPTPRRRKDLVGEDAHGRRDVHNRLGVGGRPGRRVEETPVFVNQWWVMLSSTSSRVRPSWASSTKTREISAILVASWSSIQAARPMGESAIPYSACGWVALSIAQPASVAKKNVSFS